MAKKEVRFHVVPAKDDAMCVNSMICIDKQTGVNYLFVQSGYAGGLTPLLDRDGKPIISPLPLIEE